MCKQVFRIPAMVNLEPVQKKMIKSEHQVPLHLAVSVILSQLMRNNLTTITPTTTHTHTTIQEPTITTITTPKSIPNF